MTTTGRTAAIQMNSSSEVAQNLERAAVLINQSVEYGAALVALPENFALMPRHESDRMAVVEEPGHGPIQDFLAGQAKHHGIRLVGGTVPLMAAGEKKFHASCLFFGPDGRCLARYDKIHLFDVVVSDSEAYRESDFFAAGDARTENQVCVDTPQGRLGLTICYDVRFPELYRELSSRARRFLRYRRRLQPPPAGTTGRSCCGPGPLRTWPTSLPPDRVGPMKVAV